MLVILDHGDTFIHCTFLPDRSTVTAFNSFYTHWISHFDARCFTVVHRGSNLASAEMKQNLHTLQSQLCPKPTDAPWSLGSNKRSHKFLHKAIDRLLLQPDYINGPNHSVLLSDVRIAWNLALHVNNILPHYHCFGIMPRVLGSIDTSSRLSEHQHLMSLACEITAQSRARDLLQRIITPHKRNLTTLHHFYINQRVWFHLRLHGWWKELSLGLTPQRSTLLTMAAFSLPTKLAFFLTWVPSLFLRTFLMTHTPTQRFHNQTFHPLHHSTLQLSPFPKSPRSTAVHQFRNFLTASFCAVLLHNFPSYRFPFVIRTRHCSVINPTSDSSTLTMSS